MASPTILTSGPMTRDGEWAETLGPGSSTGPLGASGSPSLNFCQSNAASPELWPPHLQDSLSGQQPPGSGLCNDPTGFGGTLLNTHAHTQPISMAPATNFLQPPYPETP